MTIAVVLPSTGTGRLRPLDAAGITVDGGFWGERLRLNHGRTIPFGLAQLDASGALGNFRRAAAGSGRYVGGMDDAGLVFPFIDSDVYKWLEAVGWELGRGSDATLASGAEDVIELVEAAQRDDGYLNTFVQLSGREPYLDLQWGHELYCIGHLLQAAIAWQRGLGDERLLAVAARAVDHIDASLGEGQREGIGGHPEIEMALVEAYRATGEERFLALARLLIERRGRGLLGEGRLGPRYWQDHEPTRTAPTVAGHAVRQMYLECGAVDVAVETGDDELLGAVIGRWEDMWARRTYLTGALGSRHRDEAFGDAFELPPDRAYAETCAAIGSVMLAWRLLLATAEPRFADAIERTLYNAVLPGLSLDGSAFFYTNPLHVRDQSVATGNAAKQRQGWYACACCPPNIMRIISAFEHLIATTDDEGLQLQQFASGTVAFERGVDPVRLRIDSGLPWSGSLAIEMQDAPGDAWTLSLRVPAWLDSAEIRVNEERVAFDAADGRLRLERNWQAGDRVELEMAMPPRITLPDDHIDAVRGCAALERGPLVYCLEAADLPHGASADDIELDTSGVPAVVEARGLPAPLRAIEVDAAVRASARGSALAWPYVADGGAGLPDRGRRTRLRLIPYFAWANREPGAMRVWIPRAR